MTKMKHVDRESLALSSSLEFMEIISAARDEVRTGKVIALDVLERKYKIGTRK